MKSLIMIIVTVFMAMSIVLTVYEQHGNADEPSLHVKQEAIISIAGFAATGDQLKLKDALGKGLEAGLTINEIKEILVQLYAYAGFPRSLNAINTFLKEHLFADIFGRDNLDYQNREIATISILTSIGNVEGQLRGHLNVGVVVWLEKVSNDEYNKFN